MRIIAGTLKGLNFNAPKGVKTHPMSDKARGGLFNALGDIDDLEVFDAFSGSGAISFEAISRGAKSSIAIEADPHAHKIIKDNVEQLKLEDRVKATRAFVRSWLNRKPNTTFDLIIADPPYNDLNFATLKRLPKHLKPTGILVLSWPKNERLLSLDQLEIVKNKDYGDAQLVFYKKIS